MADPRTLSKTDRNLWNSIVSEAMANLKYNAFAHKALEEGYPEVAQVFQEVALHSLPVRFCMDRAGLVGGDGAVHQGFLDIAYLRSFPNMALLAAIDEPTLRAALQFMAHRNDAPSALRYPRDNVATPPIDAIQSPHSL